MQALTGLTHMRSQITAQEKLNVDLMASNVSLRKSNTELACQLVDLKSRNEELSSNHAGLIEENAKIISQLDAMTEELEKEKAVSTGLKSELETATLKMQNILMDFVLSARAELMGEYKRGEHSSWDPDEETRTWYKRAAVLGGGEVSKDEEEMSTLAIRNPKVMGPGDGYDQAEPNTRAKDVALDVGEQVASHEDITKD